MVLAQALSGSQTPLQKWQAAKGDAIVFAQQSRVSLSALDYGVIGDGQVATDCYMASGSAVLNCESNHFIAGDVGKKIAVYGSGPTLNGFIQPCSGSITAFTSATQVITSCTAGNSTTHAIASITSCSRSQNVGTCNTSIAHTFQVGQMVTLVGTGDSSFVGTWPIQTVPTSTSFTINSVLQNNVASSSGGTADGHSEHTVWGTDNTSAMQSAIDACATAGGCKLVFPKGLYLTHGVNLPCSTIGNFTGLGLLNCTIAYNKITIQGDGEGVTTWENWDIATNNSALNGNQALIELSASCQGAFDTAPPGPLANIKIAGLSFRQVKNANSTLFTIADNGASTNVKIHDTSHTNYPRECIVEGGKSDHWDVHDNTFYQCGLGGPTVSTTGAALNMNGSYSQTHDNFVSDSGQALEGAGHDSQVYANTFYGDGPDVNSGVGPHEWLNLTSATFGLWNWTVRDNTVRGWNGAAVENVNGILANITVDNNTVIDDTVGISIGSGKETNNVNYGPQPPRAHGASSASGNRFLNTGAVYPVTYPLTINGNQHPLLEDVLIANDTITFKTGYCDIVPHTACLQTADCTGGGAVCRIPPGPFAIPSPGLGPVWTINTVYATGAVSVPSSENSYIYINKGASGTSGGTEPIWCTVTNCTVTDGTITWTLYGTRPKATVANIIMLGPAGVTTFGNEISVITTPAAGFSLTNFFYNNVAKITLPSGAIMCPAGQAASLSNGTCAH